MIITRKKYRNYAEQVNDNVLDLELINIEDYDEFWWEDLYNLCYDNLTDNKIKELEKESGYESTDDDFYEYVSEYIMQGFEGIYQTYKVELKGNYNSEHERLEIIWNEKANCYVMPVYAYGMSWSMLGVSN